MIKYTHVYALKKNLTLWHLMCIDPDTRYLYAQIRTFIGVHDTRVTLNKNKIYVDKTRKT